MMTSLPLHRDAYSRIVRALNRSPICFLAGPRQVGKTTLARQFLAPEHPAYFDLEDPSALNRLEAPKEALNQATPLTVIDEIQNRPDLFPLLRVLADNPRRRTSWLILDSAAPGILKGVSESLAGRVEMLEMSGFGLAETGYDSKENLFFRGGYPRSYLAATDADSLEWRKQFIDMIVSRDMPALGVTIPKSTLIRLWTMMAHCHGQLWNAAEPARALGISETTVHRLTDFFEGLYHIRLLKPWHANLGKRQVKRLKIFIRDSGLCATLLGIRDRGLMVSHPKSGSLWEGFVIEELIRQMQPDETWFWRTQNGAELDLLLVKDGKQSGYEIKLSDNVSLTPSMRIAMNDLGLEKLQVIHGGQHTWSPADGIEARPL